MRVSASQIKTFNLCQKKWYLEKVEKVPSGGVGYGAAFGTVLHRCLERLQKRQEVYPPGWSSALKVGDDLILKQLVALYSPVEGAEVELRFEMPVIDGVTMLGFIDLLKPGHVIDHKTTSSYKWALSAKELASDTQMMIYAKAALDRMEEPDLIKLQHNVFLRTPPAKMKTTLAYASPKAIMERWEQTKELVSQMREVASGSCPVVAMGSQCHAYGGCPYAGVCAGTLTKGQFLAVKAEEKKMADELSKKLALLEARKKGGPTASLPPEVRELKGLPPVEEVEARGAEAARCIVAARAEEEEAKPKRKRGRPRKVKAKETTLTVYLGCSPVKGGEVGATASSDAFLQVLEFHNITPEEYYASNAFDRRDALMAQVLGWLRGREPGPLAIVSPAASTWTPDERTFYSALRLYAQGVVEAS